MILTNVDVLQILTYIIGFAFMFVIFDEIINFVSDFMLSLVKKVRNKSIQNDGLILNFSEEEKLKLKEQTNKNDGLTDLATQIKKGMK